MDPEWKNVRCSSEILCRKKWPKENIYFDIRQLVHKNLTKMEVGKPIMINSNSYKSTLKCLYEPKVELGIGEEREHGIFGCDGPLTVLQAAKLTKTTRLMGSNFPEHCW